MRVHVGTKQKTMGCFTSVPVVTFTQPEESLLTTPSIPLGINDVPRWLVSLVDTLDAAYDCDDSDDDITGPFDELIHVVAVAKANRIDVEDSHAVAQFINRLIPEDDKDPFTVASHFLLTAANTDVILQKAPADPKKCIEHFKQAFDDVIKYRIPA